MTEETKSLHGQVVSAATQEELCAAVEKALEYRGDVTITLQDGTKVAGYVFNREAAAAQPFVQLFPADKDEKAKILYKDIAAIAFTGQDLAAENSWAAYIAKTRRAQVLGAQKK
jgi:hypothetical protein